MKKILISAPMEFVDIKTKLPTDYELIMNPLKTVDDIKDMKNKEDVVSWIVSPCPTYFIDDEIISFFANLQSVVTPSTGTNHIDKENIEKKKIKILSLRDSHLYNSILASSEYSFSLILALIRKIPEASSFPLQEKWRESERYLRSREINNLTLGIVGLGRIGANVAKYASALNMNIQYFDPFVDTKLFKKVEDISEIFGKSDVVLLSPILNPSTHNLINENVLSKSKTGLLIVNTSRGEVINEQALVTYIRSGLIGGYATDVLKGEIDGSWKKSPIIELAKENYNIIVTPHIAGLTIDSESKAQNIALSLAADNLIL